MGHHPDSFCECQTQTPSFPPTTHLSKILDALNQENNVSKTLASLQSNEWQNSKNTTTNCLWYLLLYWIRNVWNRINCLLKILASDHMDSCKTWFHFFKEWQGKK